MTIQEQIAAREKELGRPLQPQERLRFMPAGQRLGDRDAGDLKIILTETREGIALKKAFDESVQQAELVHNLQMRHTAALSFNQAKRSLLRQFREGKLDRIKPPADSE